jgi:hypothetical protein
MEKQIDYEGQTSAEADEHFTTSSEQTLHDIIGEYQPGVAYADPQDANDSTIMNILRE